MSCRLGELTWQSMFDLLIIFCCSSQGGRVDGQRSPWGPCSDLWLVPDMVSVPSLVIDPVGEG